MTLGVFLLAIFLLWLIDKHNLWRRALKAVLVLIAIGALGMAGIWVRNERIAKRLKAEEEAEQRAAEAAKHTRLADCIKRMATAQPQGVAELFRAMPPERQKALLSKMTPQQRGYLDNALKAKASTDASGSAPQVDAQSTCEQDPDATPTSEPKWYKMQASDGKWYKALAFSAQEARNKIDGSGSQPHRPHQVHHLFATGDVDLDTSEFGDLVCAHVAKGETVTLLEDDSSWVKVKTQAGKTGWADGSDFEMTD